MALCDQGSWKGNPGKQGGFLSRQLVITSGSTEENGTCPSLGCAVQEEDDNFKGGRWEFSSRSQLCLVIFVLQTEAKGNKRLQKGLTWHSIIRPSPGPQHEGWSRLVSETWKARKYYQLLSAASAPQARNTNEGYWTSEGLTTYNATQWDNLWKNYTRLSEVQSKGKMGGISHSLGTSRIEQI